MEFYRLHNGFYILIELIDGDIIQSNVLPGFQFRISDLHRRPSFETMVDDPVYQGFILPNYQQKKIARQQAEQQAQEAQQLSKVEAKRAEKN
jgi:hypothetical protein